MRKSANMSSYFDNGGFIGAAASFGTLFSPNFISSGLTVHLDAANTASYPGSGTTWFDISGNSRNMTLTGGVSYDTQNNGRLIFDGVNGYGQISNCGITTGNTPHTIEIWANFNVITSTRWWLAVLGQYNTGGHHMIGVSPTGTQFGVFAGTPQRSPNLLGNNQWLHICMTWDGTNLTDYVNTVSTGSGTGGGFNFTNSNFSLGLRLGTESFYNGRIGIVRIYNRALSAEEVGINFRANNRRYGL